MILLYFFLGFESLKLLLSSNNYSSIFFEVLMIARIKSIKRVH